MRERLWVRCQQAGASLLAGHSAIQGFRAEVEVNAEDAESPDKLLSPLPPLSLPPAATSVLKDQGIENSNRTRQAIGR